MPTLATNKKAFHDYEVLKTYEAGLKLTGQEVKSAKNGGAKLKGSYVVVGEQGPSLLNMHIAPYTKAGSIADYDPYRSRALLLNKKEIDDLIGKRAEKGLTFVPLKLYTKHGRIKLEFAVARGKKKFEKRASIKERDIKRKLKRDYGV